eukprot:TRINITY_DN3613_c0_g1_i4.p1 TRINITY_DN3613_c0_g1~~TRINITY_DN3613_c0_g1_i4.p1  ORF type:complete len:668 (+),score=198.15 TRINITY_DN3613_c0_g1_i4:321-2324(+)
MGAAYVANPTYARIKKLLFPTFELLCRKYPENVIDQRQANSFWSMVHKEISMIDIKKEGLEKEVVQSYLDKCDEAIGGFISCYNIVKDAHKPLETPLHPSNKVRRLAASLLIFIGDYMRYKMKAAKKLKVPMDPLKAQNEVLQSYMEAKAIYPFEGKIYNQIALTLAAAGDSLGCMYYFVRCVFCEYPFTVAMESLIKHFDKIGAKYADMVRVWSRPSASKLSLKLRPSEEQQKSTAEEFWISFYRLLGIIFNKIDCDKCREVSANVLSKLRVYLKLLASIKDEDRRKDSVEGLENAIVLLIFGVHYSVLGGIEKGASGRRYDNEQALLNDTGLISLNALADVVAILAEVISTEHEETYSIIVPLCYWFATNDELRRHIWDKHKEIKRSLSNVYRTLTETELPAETTEHTNDMLSDDYRYIGFVPLDEMILKKSGVRVEAAKEGKVRMALVKELLSKMECEVVEPEEIKMMPAENFFKADSEELKKIHDQISKAKVRPDKPLIVVDVQNVAMKYGNGTFVCKGIEIALDFWRNKQHKVVGFMPDYLVNEREIQKLVKLKEDNPTAARASKLPDDVNYLKQLHKEGVVVTTPPQDYDDSYCIEYAKKHKGYIVTNDKFRDHINMFMDKERKAAESIWIRRNRIGFAFKGDEFLPNPDAEFFKIYGEDG